MRTNWITNKNEIQKLNYQRLSEAENQRSLMQPFLETSTHLYKRLCPSVNPSVLLVLFTSNKKAIEKIMPNIKRLGNLNAFKQVWASLSKLGHTQTQYYGRKYILIKRYCFLKHEKTTLKYFPFFILTIYFVSSVLFPALFRRIVVRLSDFLNQNR